MLAKVEKQGEHLHVVVDEPFFKEDWVFFEGEACRFSLYLSEYKGEMSKIAGSTMDLHTHDPITGSLGKVPGLSEGFVEKWNSLPESQYKISVKNDEISVTVNGLIQLHPIKASYSKTEVIGLLEEYREYAWINGLSKKDLDEWKKTKIK